MKSLRNVINQVQPSSALNLGKSDWHQRLGGGGHADAIMDRIVHISVWLDAGLLNMREHFANQE